MNEILNEKVSEDEIDLIELLKKVYLEKKFILKTSILVALFGVVFALFQPNEFTASATFIPQLGSSEFPPTLYPQVVESVPFKLQLLSSSIKNNNQELSLREYILSQESSILGIVKKYTIELPSLILSYFKKNDESTNNSQIYSISQEDEELFKELVKVFSLSLNDKEGFITMSFTDRNKSISAQVVKIAQSLLQEKIIEYKVQSSKELLDFTKSQYNEKKVAFEKLQDERAVFVDKNINISSSLYQNKLSRIESDLSIAQTVVQQLASQVEQAKLQVNKDTPVFTTIKPVTVPFEKSAPKRSLIVISFAFLGFVLSCGYVLVKEPATEILKSIKS